MEIIGTVVLSNMKGKTTANTQYS